MRTTAALLASALVLPVLATAPTSGAAPHAAAPVAAPAVKKVRTTYGGEEVRLSARQGVDIAFNARARDRVMLDLRSTESRAAPCFGTQTLRDGRGSRSARIDGRGSAYIMTVRTPGRTVLSFRGYCSHNKGQEPLAAAAQLTKVRLREVGREQRRSVRAPRRGFLDVATVTVPRHGRDTMTLRHADRTRQDVYTRGRVLVGNRLSFDDLDASVSVEAGYPIAQGHMGTYGWRSRLRPGQVVGLAAVAEGYAQSLRARTYRTSLDAPAITLPAETGREHVLIYEATPEDRAYVIPVGLPAQQNGLNDANLSWGTWARYSGGPDQDDPSLQRTIVLTEREGADAPPQQVRVRRTVRVGDLVVGGPAVTFASADPGTRFVSTIPASAAGTVRLTASNVSATGPWETDVPLVRCGRCLGTGLTAGQGRPVVDGWVEDMATHELLFYFEPGSSGSVTLELTDIP